MADYDRRGGGGRGGGGGGYNRKRRYRDDNDDDHHYRGNNSRRRYDAPPHVRIRKQLIAIAENPMIERHDEISQIANLFTDNWEDDVLLRGNFVDLVLQLCVEQPLKTPFLAGVLMVANTNKPEVVDMLLEKAARLIEDKLREGEWRDVKLYLKLVGCLQGVMEGDGIFGVLTELFERAVGLQTASSEDTIGTEIVKIILLTLPYVMAAGSPEQQQQWQQKAADLLENTAIIASEPHPLQAVIEPYHPEPSEENPTQSQSLISLLQAQLQIEATQGWALSCLPRPWQFPVSEVEVASKLASAPKHTLPTIIIPKTVVTGPRPLFPEVYISVYGQQEVESVPPPTSLASSLIRDALLDTINVLHFNRNATARQLIEVDCYFAPRTFALRGTPFDRLRDIEKPKSTWKPEDVAVDAVFTQLFLLPNPEHKLVYYHSVLTEACKLAPAAIAPSLGRAIRYLYRNAPRMDLELAYRFMDWFSHHLSNFGFTWKWTEWVDDVELSGLHPRKAFIVGSIDKEIRLSFAQRIKNTLPEPYQQLIGPEKEKDVPDFKFANDDTPFAAEGREIAALLKRKAPDEEIDAVIQRIQSQAIDRDLDALVASTDVFVTCVLYVGSKSLSHVLAAIERTKDRLADAGAASDASRTQIIEAVMAYWSVHPGVALSIVEKLLNYSILTPLTVINWALNVQAGKTHGEALAFAHIYELVFNTVIKVTGRVRQLVIKASQPDEMVDDETKDAEIKNMRELFRAIEDSLGAWAQGTKDEMLEREDGSEGLVKRWGTRWLRVFKRRQAIEEAFLVEAVRERERKEEVRKEWEVVEQQRAAEKAAKEEEAKKNAPAAENGASGEGEKEKENGAEVDIVE
ncbi:putative nuclear cap-binding protein complex subunit 1 [Triangularia verruculosa]|uniref:Nuclear cap-binding protein complex subunit 1 n=1 Tax=Triangularia verruculosa TaxID=2587418 RepID=A0AAN7AZ52_9PEZI|nr:putative nuclear cap-binding protein complex subunit 1 [Triangularia verruculosa]